MAEIAEGSASELPIWIWIIGGVGTLVLLVLFYKWWNRKRGVLLKLKHFGEFRVLGQGNFGVREPKILD